MAKKEAQNVAQSPQSPTDSEITAVNESNFDVEANKHKDDQSNRFSRSWKSVCLLFSFKPALRDRLETRKVEEGAYGYALVANFQSSDRNFLQWRGFLHLHARLLSALQCDIVCLEEELDKLDEWDAKVGGKRLKCLQCKSRDDRESVLAKMPEDFEFSRTRPELLKVLKEKLLEYDEVLFKTKEVNALQRPSNRDYESVQNWFESKKPLVQDELRYIRKKEDIVTLRTGRECAGFDGFVERCLIKIDLCLESWFGCNIIKRLFMTPELREKTGDELLRFYAPSRVDMLVSIIITAIIFILLVLPVVALYELSDLGRRGSPVEAIGILIIFTLLFGFAMASLTTAKRGELFAACAAYCAVLVVFIGNFGVQSVTLTQQS